MLFFILSLFISDVDDRMKSQKEKKKTLFTGLCITMGHPILNTNINYKISTPGIFSVFGINDH